ncbi:hypothetical protein DSC45_00800 [Streptomyces sp. YIM 130001]|uniref:DoxX family protein n=1 Tax=Streptomyces sp. YIM 130001 TaxID=2259644 RepID=UPI000E6575D9|nr:DoxX family protein [Streptomyces sp. YIM 130001]RII22249.1 hypothetical protein DSC45_00800 [Streptomyces sp. YIM 130001]
MFIAYVVVTVAAVLANAASAFEDFRRSGFVVANSTEVGVPQSWLPWLATLKAAGAGGLLLGLVGAAPLGIAAGVGLVLFFVGAMAAHVRARVFHNIAFPGAYLALTVSALVLAAAR